MMEQQLFDERGQIVERVAKIRRVGLVAITEAKEIGSDNMELVSELRDQIAEHMRGRRKAVQQNNRWSSGGTGFAVENLVAVDGGVVMFCHGCLL
jgi:hypothetical protein